MRWAGEASGGLLRANRDARSGVGAEALITQPIEQDGRSVCGTQRQGALDPHRRSSAPMSAERATATNQSQLAPLAKPVRGDFLMRASVAGPYRPSAAILSLGLLWFHRRWKASTPWASAPPV